MADRIRNHELQGRLNQIDVRLRLLEEKERPQESNFTGGLKARARKKPTPTIIDDVHLKNTLMDRLQSLETKIRQLSNELQQGSDTGYRAISSATEKQKQVISNNSSRRMFENDQRSKKARCTLMPRRVSRWMRSCIFCTGDDHYCLNSSSTDVCEAQGIHASCYH